MFVAAEYPFESMIGIELSEVVCRQARRIIAKLPKTRYGDRITIVQGDASRPTLPDAPEVVLFHYHPFRKPLFQSLVAHLETEIANPSERKVWVIYYNPVCFDVFDDSKAFSRYFAAKIDFEDDERVAQSASNTYDSVIIYRTGAVQRPALPGADARVVTTVPDLAVEVQS